MDAPEEDMLNGLKDQGCVAVKRIVLRRDNQYRLNGARTQHFNNSTRLPFIPLSEALPKFQ